MRASAFRQVGGFDPTVIAGEEPELCHRLRAAGWRIMRLDADMATHDAAMTRFSQWWRRTVRGGYGYALGTAMHGRGPHGHYVRECRSIVLWGLAMPLAGAGLALVTHGWGLLLFLVYPLQAWRIARRLRARKWSSADRWLYAAACMLAKWPQLAGWWRFQWGRFVGRRSRIIEYKGASRPGATQ